MFKNRIVKDALLKGQHTVLKRFSHSIPPVAISEEIRQAISENVPVVSLESTIITHGLPYPENISMAKEVENLIRQMGAVPATIAFIKGIPTVGLTQSDLEILGQTDMNNVKISRRDIPNVMARKVTGGTTIAATMILSHMAGIDVFSTGGLGGISRPWSLFDVSADLEELGKTPVAVVCSGPKSILDIQRTMEYLETKGVPVSTYIDDAMVGNIDTNTRNKIDILRKSKDPKDLNELNHIWESLKVNIPGFYVRDSGIRSPYVWENPYMAANMIYNGKYSMNMENGYVFCAPAPVEVAMDKVVMDKIIDEAQYLAEKFKIGGKELTPFMLKTLYEKTNGASAECNVAFVKNNAILGSKIALELSKFKGGKNTQFQPEPHTIIEDGNKALYNANIGAQLVVGSVAVDTMCKMNTNQIKLKDSNPGKIMKSSIGGVGFNVALAATCSNSAQPVVLITALNKGDNAGKQIIKKLQQSSMPIDGMINLTTESTAQYISMHDFNGNLAIACADMDIIEKIPSEIVIEMVDKYKPKSVLFDTNISIELMNEIIQKAKKMGIKLMIEPTSGVKCGKLGKCNLPVYPNTPVELITPTIEELSVMFSSFAENGKFEDIDEWFNVLDAIGAGSELRERLVHASHQYPIITEYLQNGIFQQAFQLLPFFPNIVVKDGKNGVLLFQITNRAIEACDLISRQTLKYKDGRESFSDFIIVSDKGRHNLGIVIQHFNALQISDDQVKNVTGAGDSLAGYMFAHLSESESTDSVLAELNNSVLRENFIMKAQAAAVTSLLTEDSVNETAIKELSI